MLSREAEKEQTSNCDPNYDGGCLDPTSSDCDRAVGSGDGPDYRGPVTVVGVPTDWTPTVMGALASSVLLGVQLGIA